MPELEAHTKGRDVLLMFEKDIGPAIAFACDYNDTMHMAKTIEMIRCQLATKKTTFSGSLVSEDIDDSIPPPLLQSVKMIEHGPNIKSQLDNVSTNSDLALAQLLMFNYHLNTQKAPVQHRHSADRETPLCVYLGLLLFAKTRKRQLIDTLFQHGLRISYDRVLEISTQLGEAVVERYLNEGVVCQPLLKGKVFTTAAVDSIDHNPSSTTSKSSFHVTGNSIFQHPMKDNVGVRRDQIILPTSKPKSKKVPELPDAYMNMKPAYLKTKPEPLILPEDVLAFLTTTIY
ncbi:unnamed protein product [Mytilus coruscus]|uniref:Uncharacterized protein n=1 Tax=Mytilus coruscus TaxID=42192 RepID=A0A6J8CZQ4_MYTCO|nr:unnamed protein product [Mytilus coruscus]